MKDILDSDLFSDSDKSIASIKAMLNESEEVVWAGKPKYVFSVTPLEIGGYDIALGPTNLYFIGLGVFVLKSIIAYQDANYLLAVVYLFLGLLIFSQPDVVKEIRRRKTAYVTTDENVFFSLWKFHLLKGGRQAIHKMPIQDIHDVRYEEYKDKSGTLYLMPRTPVNFKTYNFSTGAGRHHPTFENIENVVSLQKEILELRRKINQ